MDLDMATEFIGPSKPFVTLRKGTSMRFFSSVCSNMAYFMFKTIEGFVTEFALVGALVCSGARGGGCLDALMLIGNGIHEHGKIRSFCHGMECRMSDIYKKKGGIKI